uniref:High osmolarity signaling protein sho1 n=1 Tax=Anthurium amnicola TaxID=1678845 RepID=A0A1D1YBR1_9ARAE
MRTTTRWPGWSACFNYLQGSSVETGLAVTVISSNISASINLASLSIALSSLIGTWFGSSSKLFMTEVIYGDTSLTTTSIKYVALLVCFLAAFTSFIQSARYFVHASFLISTIDSDMPVSYVQTAVIRGGNFWSVGLRSLYFATTLLLWIFGPIPMFACSLAMVVILYIFDTNTTPLHQFQRSSNKYALNKTDRNPKNQVSQALHRPSSNVDNLLNHSMYYMPSITN